MRENDTWKTHLSVEQQGHMANYWKQLRHKCYDYWMNEVDNENLMQAHGILKEAVSRCTRDFREKTNHAPWRSSHRSTAPQGIPVSSVSQARRLVAEVTSLRLLAQPLSCRSLFGRVVHLPVNLTLLLVGNLFY
ncbi:unnamed protein product [Symbiodinium natans]|uniref:Uncharacterized protein n=1 Tax=Symbiodinium natans TaxID=878477 RepID=A0A812QV91_9DINO|nr:unnamed protein product [Symbiodinium natans]